MEIRSVFGTFLLHIDGYVVARGEYWVPCPPRIQTNSFHPDPGRETVWIVMDRRPAQLIEVERLQGLTLGQ